MEGFVVNHGGAYHAYVNRCPHVGTPLDLWPNEFYSEDGRELVCATHGALYEPTTGRCTAGPCVGDTLTRRMFEMPFSRCQRSLIGSQQP